MKIQIPTKTQILLKSLATIAISGSMTGVAPILQSAYDTGALTHIDWHKVFQVAGVGAGMALFYHFKQSLLAPTIVPNATDPSNTPAKSL